MKSFPLLPSAVALGCLAACACAFAQTNPPVAANVLEKITVTATRVPTLLADVIADLTVIDRDQIDQAGQLSLRDLLGQQAGVQFSSNGSYRSSTGVFRKYLKQTAWRDWKPAVPENYLRKLWKFHVTPIRRQLKSYEKQVREVLKPLRRKAA